MKSKAACELLSEAFKKLLAVLPASMPLVREFWGPSAPKDYASFDFIS